MVGTPEYTLAARAVLARQYFLRHQASLLGTLREFIKALATAPVEMDEQLFELDQCSTHHWRPRSAPYGPHGQCPSVRLYFGSRYRRAD